MFRNLNCPITSCLWVFIIMVALLMAPLFPCLATFLYPPEKCQKSCKHFHFATCRLVTPPKPPRRTTPTRSVERPKISTVLLPTYSNNVNTNNTNISVNTTSMTDPAHSMDLSSFTAVSSSSSSTFLVRLPYDSSNSLMIAQHHEHDHQVRHSNPWREEVVRMGVPKVTLLR